MYLIFNVKNTDVTILVLQHIFKMIILQNIGYIYLGYILYTSVSIEGIVRQQRLNLNKRKLDNKESKKKF